MKLFFKLMSVFALMLYFSVSAEAQALTSKDINAMPIEQSINADGKMILTKPNGRFGTTTPNLLWSGLYLPSVNAILQNYYQKGQMNTYLGSKADTSAVAKIGGMYNFNGSFTGFGLGLNQATIPQSNGIRLGYNTKQQGLGSQYPYSWSEYTDGKFLFNTKSGTTATGRSLQDLSFQDGRLIGNYYNYSPGSNTLWGGSGFEFFSNAQNTATDGLVGEMNFVQKFAGGTSQQKMGLSFLRGAYDPNVFSDTKEAGNLLTTSAGVAYVKQEDGTYDALAKENENVKKGFANPESLTIGIKENNNNPNLTLYSEDNIRYSVLSSGEHHLDNSGINVSDFVKVSDGKTNIVGRTLNGIELENNFSFEKNKIKHEQKQVDGAIRHGFEISSGQDSTSLAQGVLSYDNIRAGKIEFTTTIPTPITNFYPDGYRKSKRGIFFNLSSLGLNGGPLSNNYIETGALSQSIASDIDFGSVVIDDARYQEVLGVNGNGNSYQLVRGADMYIVDSSIVSESKFIHRFVKEKDLEYGISEGVKKSFGFEKAVEQNNLGYVYIPKQIAIDGQNSLQRNVFVIQKENPSPSNDYKSYEYTFVNKKSTPIQIVANNYAGNAVNVIYQGQNTTEVPANTTFNVINLKNYSSEIWVVISATPN